MDGDFPGLVIGGFVGMLVGFLLVQYPPGGASIELVAVLIAAVVGAMFGTWVASMVGLQVPNSRLKAFDPEIQEGKILLILAIPPPPFHQLRSITPRTPP